MQFLLPLTSAIYALLRGPTPTFASGNIFDQITLLESQNSSLLQYPSQFTQGIIPKYIHSHNDYWRDVPLLTALSYGAQSVEADVWLVGNTLYVGHERAALSKDRTFDSLYIQPLLQILALQNPHNDFTGTNPGLNGVFDIDSSAVLQLLVEIKTDGPSTLPSVITALEPLRQRGYLTTYDNSTGTLTQSVITVVGTGNTPLSGVQALAPRDFFYDGPLASLTDAGGTVWGPNISPLASTDYVAAIGWDGLSTISATQLNNIKTLVSAAKAKGIRSRFWGSPGWPISARNNIWTVLLENGVDWVNADDLEAASLL